MDTGTIIAVAATALGIGASLAAYIYTRHAAHGLDEARASADRRLEING